MHNGLHIDFNKIPKIYATFNITKSIENGITDVTAEVSFCGDGTLLSEIKNVKVVIIHQGVLETFFKEALVSRTDYEVLLEKLQWSIPYVIVDSGRGIPSKLPDKAKFMPFSLIEDFIKKEYIAKYSLVQNIMPLIRRQNNV